MSRGHGDAGFRASQISSKHQFSGAHHEHLEQPHSKENKINLPDALINVDNLDNLELPDKQPCIEAAPISIHYEARFDTNFEDKGAFVSGVARYMEEAQVHADMNKLLDEGMEASIMLYTWRCCSRALPNVRSNEQPNRVQIYEKTVEVLQPQVQKLMDLYYFTGRAIKCFISEVSTISHEQRRNDFISEAHLLTLGKFINMFAILDELKNMKASVKNDYSAFRRAAQFLKVHSNPKSLEESQNLSMYLAQQNQIRDDIKKALMNITGYEDLFCDIINLSIHMYETTMYITPDERHQLVKIMSFSLTLLDSSIVNINKLDNKKRLNLSKIDKILKHNEVVPLFGDMQISPFTYIKRTQNFDSGKWPLSNAISNNSSATTSPQAALLTHIGSMREQHCKYMSELSKYSNEAITTTREQKKTPSHHKTIYNIALKGLQLLSSWNSSVMELYSWKLLHPTDSHQNKDCPKDAVEYERSTRYNYSSDEKFCLVEVIAMIKGLQNVMLRMEYILMDAIRFHVHYEMQQFIQIDLREPMRKAAKKKCEIIRSIIMSVRETGGDWSRGQQPLDDPILHGKKSPLPPDTKIPERNVGPSSTQLYMVRTMMESLIADKNVGGKKTLKKDIDVEHINMITAFHRNSFYWPYLLNFNSTLHRCCELSQLWYREFFLEMTMGEKIQFPIEMSMPWILTDHILETPNAAMIEYILYPLDLYNDSAQYALNTFKKQFLFDELEAEVNLCFDQFIYKLSDLVFVYYKHWAGSIMLNKQFRTECAKFGTRITYPVANRYETLLQQKHFQLLGRSIDLNRLIAQRINVAIQRSLDIAIAKFNSENLSSIIGLVSLIECNRLTHKLLKRYLPLRDFDEMFREANYNVTAPYGRITLHVFWELSQDFLPNYCYNASSNRFVQSKFLVTPTHRDKWQSTSFNYLYGTKALTMSFDAIHNLTSGYIGSEHMTCITQLLGYQGIAVVIEELLKIAQSLIQGNLLGYVQNLMGVMPKRCKLVRYDYGSHGLLEYYKTQLDDVTRYTELKTDVFSILRELGNIIIFCMLIEQSLSLEEVYDLKHAAPFQNVIPKPFIPTKEGDTKSKREQEYRTRMKRNEVKYAPLQIVQVVSKLGTQQQADTAREGDLLTRERLCCGLSMFEIVLLRIRSFLETSDVWDGKHPLNDVWSIDESDSEFHRLWSAMQFVFCTPIGDNEVSIEEHLGEGLNWAGCTLVALLHQQKRFEALDFSYHLLRVFKIDQDKGTTDAQKVSRGIDLKKMTERIRVYQILNEQIFATLNKYLKFEELQIMVQSSNGRSATDHVTMYNPPSELNQPHKP